MTAITTERCDDACEDLRQALWDGMPVLYGGDRRPVGASRYPFGIAVQRVAIQGVLREVYRLARAVTVCARDPDADRIDRAVEDLGAALREYQAVAGAFHRNRCPGADRLGSRFFGYVGRIEPADAARRTEQDWLDYTEEQLVLVACHLGAWLDGDSEASAGEQDEAEVALDTIDQAIRIINHHETQEGATDDSVGTPSGTAVATGSAARPAAEAA